MIINNKEYQIGDISLTKTRDRGWIAEIMFEIVDSSGFVLGTEVVAKYNLDYNDFWNNFNSGTYLFELLLSHLNASEPIPSTIEEVFVNPN